MYNISLNKKSLFCTKAYLYLLLPMVVFFLSLPAYSAQADNAPYNEYNAYKVYKMQIQSEIEYTLKEKSIKIPSEMQLEGKFTSDGKMMDAKITKSSGDEAFDKQIVDIINNLGYFGKPPKREFMPDKFTITMHKAPPYSDKDNLILIGFGSEKSSKSNFDKINWSPYLGGIEKRIKGNWHPPRNIKSQNVVAYLDVLKDGTIDNIYIIKSSGDREMDNSAREAITKSSPYLPLPEQFTGNFITIELTFDRNVIGFSYNPNINYYKPKKPASPELIQKIENLSSDYYIRYQSKNPWL